MRRGGLALPAAPRLPTGVPRAVVLATLSQALDVTEGEPPGHALRSAWIAVQLAGAIGLPERPIEDVFWAALLKDAGCSANAHAVADWFGTDDRRAKRDLKRVNWSRAADAVQFAVAHARPGQPWTHRVSQWVRLARRGRRAATDLVAMRCTRGAEVVRELGWIEAVPDAVLYLDEHWDGSGEPYGLVGRQIPILARILSLAQTLEIFWRDHGPDAALAMAHARSGHWFDPELVAALDRSAQAAFWEALASIQEPADALTWAPGSAATDRVGAAELVHLGQVFAAIVDAKSPWTARHSARTADLAAAIAGALGWAPEAVAAAQLAAQWHDLGKLAVSNTILDKPGPLTPDERAVIATHPAWTERLLRPLVPLADVTRDAAAHHERLDGCGYHHGWAGDAVPPGARIVAVADIFEALTAARPYKAPQDPADALAWLRRSAGAHVDPTVVEALAQVVAATPTLAEPGASAPPPETGRDA